ncbi:MAG: hypothetical protein WCP53_00340, partial [Verrucomicrobiota bacterium]
MADDAQLQNMLHELDAHAGRSWKVVQKKHSNKKSTTAAQNNRVTYREGQESDMTAAELMELALFRPEWTPEQQARSRAEERSKADESERWAGVWERDAGLRMEMERAR